MVVDEKNGVEFSAQSKVQNLHLEVTKEALGELLMKTLQYQTAKGNFWVNSMVEPR